ncbi:unnamed protein product [Parascedosporium putredinis]|uniref:Uncharacterized protein n=1 Tax=Parascedosporium putredinis TaxID=1442378 RepID=A0A9P1MDU6_9PEZI|nr:unnamed protein product [Parascedosporium putredinis]CAI8000295.1 unnamed protein product [Parascedosporium putredinis]
MLAHYAPITQLEGWPLDLQIKQGLEAVRGIPWGVDGGIKVMEEWERREGGDEAWLGIWRRMVQLLDGLAELGARLLVVDFLKLRHWGYGNTIDRDERRVGPPLKRTTPHDVDPTLDPHSTEANAAAADDAGWETVHRNKKAKKMPRKDKKKYPSIDFSQNAKLYSKVRVADLRDLILYIFADGIAPKWVSVANRGQIRKIVTIMVPGIEETMFKPNVDFSNFDAFVAKQKPVVDEDGLPSPDAFYPRALDTESLHSAVKPFADMFTRLWPIKTPATTG